MDNQTKFEGWAVVELMGHQKEIGFVTTEYFGQACLFRVDTPELPEREFVLTRPTSTTGGWSPAGSKVKRECMSAKTRLLAPGSLYAVNPCTEEAARTALEHLVERPLILIEAPARPAIAAGEVLQTGDYSKCLDCGLSETNCQCDDKDYSGDDDVAETLRREGSL